MLPLCSQTAVAGHRQPRAREAAAFIPALVAGGFVPDCEIDKDAPSSGAPPKGVQQETAFMVHVHTWPGVKRIMLELLNNSLLSCTVFGVDFPGVVGVALRHDRQNSCRGALCSLLRRGEGRFRAVSLTP